MRAILDANVYISYLLSPDADTPPKLLVDAAISGAYALLLTEKVLTEVRHKTATKPYLAARITQPRVERLIEILDAVAEAIADVAEPFPELGPDRKDDYLFAHAAVGRADYPVSGDFGVQGVGRIGDVRIATPAEFLQILRDAGWEPQPTGDLR